MSLPITYSWKLWVNMFFVSIKSQINALWELVYLKSSHLIQQLLVRINFIAGIELGAVDVWINETQLRSSKIFEFSVRERPINTRCQYHMRSAHIEVSTDTVREQRRSNLFIPGRSIVVLGRKRNSWAEFWRKNKDS